MKTLKESILKEIFDLADRKCDKQDKGKWDPYVEKLEDYIYGIYMQTKDSPFGDRWEAYIVQIVNFGVRILSREVKDGRFYTKDLFERMIREIPYGIIKDTEKEAEDKNGYRL